MQKSSFPSLPLKFRLATGLLFISMIIPGCGHPSNTISIVSQNTEFICSFWDEECRTHYQEIEKNPVVLSGDNDIVSITVTQNTCTDLEVDSIKKKEDLIMIYLVEEGMACTGGSDLTTMTLDLSEPISLNHLTVYKEPENDNEFEQVFPFVE